MDFESSKVSDMDRAAAMNLETNPIHFKFLNSEMMCLEGWVAVGEWNFQWLAAASNLQLPSPTGGWGVSPRYGQGDRRQVEVVWTDSLACELVNKIAM